MNKASKAILGLATFGQIPIILIFGIGDVDVPMWFILGVVVVEVGLWIFYLLDVRKNSRVPADRERRWFWALFVFGPLAESVYFWRFIRGYELEW
jgi:hypothetical protein